MGKLSKKQIDEIKQLKKAGFTNNEISESFGCHPSAISYHMVRSSLKNKRQRNVTTKEAKDILNLKSDGMSVEDIAKKTGFGRSTVYKVIKEKGKDLAPLRKTDKIRIKRSLNDKDPAIALAIRSVELLERILKKVGI